MLLLKPSGIQMRSLNLYYTFNQKNIDVEKYLFKKNYIL